MVLTVNNSCALATAICCFTSLINWSFWAEDRLSPTPDISIFDWRLIGYIRAMRWIWLETQERRILIHWESKEYSFKSLNSKLNDWKHQFRLFQIEVIQSPVTNQHVRLLSACATQSEHSNTLCILFGYIRCMAHQLTFSEYISLINPSNTTNANEQLIRNQLCVSGSSR